MSEDTYSIEELFILQEVDKGLSASDLYEKYGKSLREMEVLIEGLVNKRIRLGLVYEDEKSMQYINILEEDIGEVQLGTMKIGSLILKHLSEGIYNSPAGSIKELISNAYDADADEVIITTGNNEVTIYDNGDGMDFSDFDRNFTFISSSLKRSKSEKTIIYERPIIGFLGIGFLSVSELCDVMRVKSAKRGSKLIFEAEINFKSYQQYESELKEFYEISEFKLTNYYKVDKGYNEDEHFTEIKLVGLKEGFKRILDDKKPFTHKPLSIKDIIDRINLDRMGVDYIGEYWKMLLQLSYTIPVRYYDNKVVTNDEYLNELQKRLMGYNFTVVVDGISLVKPFMFPLNSDTYKIHKIGNTIELPSGTLSYEGYVYSQHGMIYPKEFIGLMIRIKNVAIGGIIRDLLNYPSGSSQLFRNWIFGEIYVNLGLENSMNINRNGFKIHDPLYIKLKEDIHEELSKNIFDHTRKNYWKKGSIERREQKIEDERLNLVNFINKREYKLTIRHLKKDIVTNQKNNRITLNTNSRIFKKYQYKEQLTLERIFVFLEIALNESKGNATKMKEIFYNLLTDWKK